MADHVSVENLRRGYKAFGDADMVTLAEIIPENAVWHVPGNNSLSGDYRGRDAVFGYFGELVQKSGGTFKAELVHAVGDDSFAVAIQHTTATINGQTYDGTDILVDRVDENGLAVETWVYVEKQALLDEMMPK